jgi:hypothetical protein
MSNYGKNFEFRIAPHGTQRYGRVIVPDSGTALPIGAPVALDGTVDVDSRGFTTVALVTGATAPITGKHGLAIYEFKNSEAFAGYDPSLTTYSDLNTIPLAAAIQLVSGPDVKVVFRNTSATVFLGQRSYPAFTMVAGLGATPTVAVGDYLTPGTGNSTSGFWAENATASNGWFVVTNVDVARQEVEARMTF